MLRQETEGIDHCRRSCPKDILQKVVRQQFTDITCFFLTDSWEVTDDELTFATCGPPEPEYQIPLVEKAPEAAPNPKRRQSVASKAKSETPKPSVVVPAPTFAPPESDSDFEMKEDDEEYTEERRRARKKNVSCNLSVICLAGEG
jgi:hypothetical protein